MTSALSGLKLVVTAGPTYEDIDPARFIGNRSSGKMGFAIARQAQLLGADVTLIAGPVHLQTPEGVTRIDVRSAQQMHDAVMASLPADVYVGAAAVADYRPAKYASIKIKKQDDDEGLVLELEQTTDILKTVANAAQRPRIVCGFAAETHDVEGYAQGKLERKNVDLIAANKVGVAGSGFEADTNTLFVFTGGQERKLTLGPASKQDVAAQLLQHIATLL